MCSGIYGQLIMLLIYQITEFMKVQYLQNKSRHEIDWFKHRCPKKQPFDSNIYVESAQKFSVTLKITDKLLYKWGVCIIYIRISKVWNMWVGIYRRDLLIQDMSRTIYMYYREFFSCLAFLIILICCDPKHSG